MLKKNIALLLLPLSIVLLSSTIDLNDLLNYSNQPLPDYINRENTVGNAITDAGATLGRVLFYDKNLSANLAVSCSSCHQQEFGFSDPLVQSAGLYGGLTGRSSMRLVNARFGTESRFFWDERAITLEDQTTQPIQDHIEMGFSGTMGDMSFDDLLERLSNLPYYRDLFTFVYGDGQITEERIQMALAQFIRSIQSFDSPFDEGLSQVNNAAVNFPNYTDQENLGKRLFLGPPNQGGAGCQACHQAPEFGIVSNSNNNGVIGVAGSDEGQDLTNTRSPSLRDLVNPQGVLNGPMMHTGSFTSLMQVIEHYNDISLNPNLDNRLRGGPNGQGQNLNLTDNEKAALVAFLETLTGSNVYTDERWSDPFGPNGELEISGGPVGTNEVASTELNLAVYPNPATHFVTLRAEGDYNVQVLNVNGQEQKRFWFRGQGTLDISDLTPGVYMLRCEGLDHNTVIVKKLMVR